jgi:hypothetical protein
MDAQPEMRLEPSRFNTSIARSFAQKLKLMPPREVAYILEALDSNERLVVWDEVKEGADPILALLSR